MTDSYHRKATHSARLPVMTEQSWLDWLICVPDRILGYNYYDTYSGKKKKENRHCMRTYYLHEHTLREMEYTLTEDVGTIKAQMPELLCFAALPYR